MPATSKPTAKLGRRPRWLLTVPFAVAAVGLIAAGCGSSTTRASGSGGYRSGAPARTDPVPPSTATPPAAAAITVGHTALGSIITDGAGRTVYLFEEDTGTTSSCDGACATAWPPVTTTSAPAVAAGGASPTLLGTTTRTDGTTQLTYAGHPLYRFVGDHKPGDTTGQGSHAFGGGWYVLTPAGEKIDNDG